MKQDIGKMIAERVLVPDPVVKNVGKVLDWPIVERKGIEVEILAKYFQDKRRTFKEWVFSNEVNIVPKERPIQRWRISQNTSEQKQRSDIELFARQLRQ